MIVPHRWSGWPGAWCLDCGIEDPLEVTLSCPDCDIKCGPNDPATDEMCEAHRKLVVLSCPQPGSRRFDPYRPATSPHLPNKGAP
jgi:hypothetical protein